jgi:hypothetical protein
MPVLYDISTLAEGIAPDFNSVLGDEIARMAAISRLLPSIFAIGAFEIRLARDDSHVDFSFFIPELATLANDGSAFTPAQTSDGLSSPWRDALQRLQSWLNGSRRNSPCAWIEIDVPAVDANVDELLPFLVHTLAECSQDDAEQRIQCTKAAVASTLDLESNDELLIGLAELVRALPAWTSVRHVALRPHASPRALRAICRMPSTQISRFVRGGPNCRAGVLMDAMLEDIFGHSTVTNANFDLSPSLGSRIGVEFTFFGTSSEDPRWTRTFDALERLGLLSPDKRNFVSSWPTPSCARRRMLAAGDSFVRDLLIKVDFDDHGATQAKAYLVFGPASSSFV